jgi:cytochrome c oxidase assembly factor CtaG
MQLAAVAASPPVDVHTLLTGWQTDIPSLLALGLEALAIALYFSGARLLGRRGRRWPGWRTACYLAGVGCVVVAVQSGLAAYDDSVFALHMVQHVLLMMVAPPLLAFGAPVTLAMQASRRGTQEKIAKFLRSPAVEVLGSPAFAFVTAWCVMFGYFLTGFYAFSLTHFPVHVATHVIFLLTGCLYCWQIICADPVRRRLPFPMRLAYAATAVPLTAVIAVALMTRASSIAPAHTLADTHAGGLVLLVTGEVIALGEVAYVAWRWSAYKRRGVVRRARGARAGHEAVEPSGLSRARSGEANG